MPLICLSGKWLEFAGFMIGEEVSVEVTRIGEIVIRAVGGECMDRRGMNVDKDNRVSGEACYNIFA